MARSKDEIIVDISTNILREEGRADIMPGQVIRDTAINAQATEIEQLYNLIDRTAIAQSISNANFMSQTDLDNLLSNFGIKRRGAEKAIGQVVFYSNTLPNYTVKIPKDTILGTNIQQGNSSEVKFVTRYDVAFDPTIESTYYNINTGNWELTVDIIAQNGGTDGNVGSYVITKVQNINSPFRVTNYNPTTGGADQESNQDFAVRALNIILGSNAGTENGYRGLALTQDNVLDVLVAGPGDTLMTRDGGFGGKVDLWIVPSPSTGYESLSPSPTSNSDLSFTWENGEQFNKNYRFDFPLKPLDASTDVVITATTAPSGNTSAMTLFEKNTPAPSGTVYIDPSGANYHYQVFKASDLDTGYTIYANDFIQWNATEMEYLRQFNPSGTPYTGNSMTVNISYEYTKAVSDLQTVLDDVNNKILTADVLAKEAEKILIDVVMNVQLLPAYKETGPTESETIGKVELAIVETINNIALGNSIQSSDIVASAHNVDGVDNVILNSVQVTKKRPKYFDATTESIVDDDALENQYFIADNISVQSV